MTVYRRIRRIFAAASAPFEEVVKIFSGMLTVALFVPCYIDQFYPQVAIATLELLERSGCRVQVPLTQTCCGQPMANSGFSGMTGGCDRNFLRAFSGADYVVCPSGSCVLHLKQHLPPGAPGQGTPLNQRLFELTEFLTDIVKTNHLDAVFPHRVGVHVACHGQRGLHTSSMTEEVLPAFSKPERLLQMVSGLEIVYPERKDECCGFGGTFCVFEEAVSVKMGKDRVAGHERNDVDFITSTDSSCLMHLEGILKRQKSRVQIRHIAEILNAGNE